MSKERDEMIATLKELVVPVLKEGGFKGSFPHFRRLCANKIDLLTFQFDRWGGGFLVEVAACQPEGVTHSWGEKVVPGKVTAWDVNQRLRLGSKGEGDPWFRYDQKGIFAWGNPYKKAACELLPFIHKQAEEYWANWKP